MHRVFLRLFDIAWGALVVVMVLAFILGLGVNIMHPFGLRPTVSYDAASGVCDDGCPDTR